MKLARYAPALLFALFCLGACDDSSTPSASNFTNAINKQLSASPPLCWGLTNNNVDMSRPYKVNLGFPPGGVNTAILAAAQSAGILSFDKKGFADGMVLSLVFKKPEAWDKKLGLCWGRKVVDKISNWTVPTNTMAQVNLHWKIEPMGWATTAVLNANGIKTEGDSEAVLQLMNTGWETQMIM